MGNSNSSKHGVVSDILNLHPITIFSATYCTYCKIAKRTFDQMGTEYNAIELNSEPSGKEIMQDLSSNYTKGQMTVPQIFICRKWIGGCNEMRNLYKTGALEAMLKDCCQGDITCRRSM